MKSHDSLCECEFVQRATGIQKLHPHTQVAFKALAAHTHILYKYPL